MVLFKNPRDSTQVVKLAKQMYPGRVKYMQQAFIDATSVPHGYVFFDLKQTTPEHLNHMHKHRARTRQGAVGPPSEDIKWKHVVTPIIRHVK